MSFAERMQKDLLDAMVDFDAAIARADLPGLHAACLFSLRQRMHQLENALQTGSTPQLLSVKRMEERVDQLKEQLATAKQAGQTMQATMLGLQKENAALVQVLYTANRACKAVNSI